MLDMDDLAYKVVLPRRWRARMELAGRVQLQSTEAALFARTGAVYAALLSITGPIIVHLIGTGDPSNVARGNWMIHAPGILAGLSNCITGAPWATNLREAANTLGVAFVGWLGWAVGFTGAARMSG